VTLALIDFSRAIREKYPAVAKSLALSLEQGGDRVEALAERILGHYRQITDGAIEPLAEAFATLVLQCNRLQVLYESTGSYRARDYDSVRANVYDNEAVMTSYMLGLVCSQFAWPNHFALWCFFEDRFAGNLGDGLRILEIAPGHGWLGLSFLANRPNSSLVGIDISASSIAMSQGIASAFGQDRATYRREDALGLPAEYLKAYDAVICGELMEHLPDPSRLLRTIRDVLKPGGRAYVTAAITAAAPDHIYEFTTPDEVLDMARSQGLDVREFICEETRAMTSKAKGPPRTLAMILS